MRRIPAYLWAAPVSLIGLIFLPLALVSGGRARVVQGVLEIHGGIVSLFLRYCTLLPTGASAMTFGHVGLGRDAELLEMTRAHERVHVRQCERWGPLFVPAYLACSLWMLIVRRRPYLDNPFER